MYSLRGSGWGDQDPAPRLHSRPLTAPVLSVHPFPSLMSSCLDLPFGTSSRLKFVPQKQERGGRRKAHVPESPQGPAGFPRVGLERDEMGPSDFPPGEEEVKNTKTAERLQLFRGRILMWNGLGSGLGF